MSARAIIAFVAVLASSACITPDKSELVPFSAAGALHGIEMTRTACNETKDAVWVIVQNKGDCIRYYKIGVFPDHNKTVYVWFDPDYMVHNSMGASWMVSEYEKLSDPLQAQIDATRHGRDLERPYIRVARPGILGSSGNHSRRRTPREVMLMQAALEKIKHRFGIEKFILMGQSGGGLIVAGLLTLRNDIRCAVLTSAGVNVKKRYRMRGRTFDFTGLYDSEIYDPIDHATQVIDDEDRWIYVALDVRDRNVPASLQKEYADAVKSLGHNVVVIEADAKGTNRHNLSRFGRDVALRCEEGPNGEAIHTYLKNRGLN